MACPPLTVLQQRDLEAPPARVDTSQFSTTTRLKGSASFTIGGPGGLPEAPPATLNASAFSTTTRLRGQIIWSPPSPSCDRQGVDVSRVVGSAPIAPPREPLEDLINELRGQTGRKPLDPLPEGLRRELLESYIRPVTTPMLQGAACEHDLAAWERLQSWGAARGFRPQSELFTCRRASGGGWEKDVIELWRQSSIHYPILLRDADALSCQRSALGGKDFGVCITWRRTNQSPGTASGPTAPSTSDACTPSLLSWYVFKPSCIQATPAPGGP